MLKSTQKALQIQTKAGFGNRIMEQDLRGEAISILDKVEGFVYVDGI